MLRKTQGRS
jgi:hypothetical protein